MLLYVPAALGDIVKEMRRERRDSHRIASS